MYRVTAVVGVNYLDKGFRIMSTRGIDGTDKDNSDSLIFLLSKFSVINLLVVVLLFYNTLIGRVSIYEVTSVFDSLFLISDRFLFAMNKYFFLTGFSSVPR